MILVEVLQIALYAFVKVSKTFHRKFYQIRLDMFFAWNIPLVSVLLLFLNETGCRLPTWVKQRTRATITLQPGLKKS